MASDSTAGGAPADMPVDPDATSENEPIDLLRLVEQLQAQKAELQDKYLLAEAETQNVRPRGQQDVERERKYGIERFARDVLLLPIISAVRCPRCPPISSRWI